MREQKGIDITNELKSQIQDIANNCDPSVKVLLHVFKNILVVEVREGIDKPYRCASGFYNRIGPNAQKLTRNDIVEFLKSEGKVRFDELVNNQFTNEDFSEEKFQLFLQRAKISAMLPTFQILKNLGCCDIDGNQILFNNLSVLFFAKNLNYHYYHTSVTCVLYKGIDKVSIIDRKEFNSDIVASVSDAMLFLEQHLKIGYKFDGSPARIEIPELPFEALREALINAVVHRDYFQKGANVMIELFDDRLEITSPGGLPKGLKQSEFGTRSLLRYPNIANLFLRIGLIEKLGTGIQRIQNLMIEAGLPAVTFNFSDFVSVIFSRLHYPINELDAEKSSEKSSEKILLLLKNNPKSTASEIAVQIGLTSRAIEKQLASLIKSGRIVRVGPDKGGYWEITNLSKK